MNRDIAEKLLTLTALLQDEYTAVEWDEAAELLTDFPNGNYILSRLRNQVPLTFLFGVPRYRAELLEPLIPLDKRKRLIMEILPYSLLLDERYTILERACLIQEAGYDAVQFCNAILEAGDRYYGSRRFGEAASEALLAIAEHQNLLRGASKPEVPANELLRAAQAGAFRNDSLLHPSEEPPAPPPRMGLMARFRQKIYRRT